MYRLFQFFTDLVLLREQPQHLPPSSTLLWLVSIAYVSLNTVHMLGVFATPWRDFGVSLADLFGILGFAWLVLRFKGLTARWLQTATALAGGGVVIIMVAIPLSLAMTPNADGMLTGVGEFAMLLYWALIVWNQFFIGHVLRHALDIPLLAGIGLGLVYSVLSGIALQLLFGPPVAATAVGS